MTSFFVYLHIALGSIKSTLHEGKTNEDTGRFIQMDTQKSKRIKIEYKGLRLNSSCEESAGPRTKE